jgi:prevent-host-death family protein
VRGESERRRTEPLRGAVAGVAARDYILAMAIVSIREAKSRLTELARRVEQGETVVVTRNGRPVLDLVPHRARGRLDLTAAERFKAKHGIAQIVPAITDDFDDPLPEDMLLRPLPPDA